jgi:hypothetical protein
MIPSLTSGSPNFAFSAAIRKVQAIAVSQPPPSAKPFTAAITGLPSVFDERESHLAPLAELTRLLAVDGRELCDIGTSND